MKTTNGPVPGTVDIGHVLDEGAFTGLQKVIVMVASIALILDGFDGQLIGYAIPSIIREWGITRDAFIPAVAAGLVGMAIGSAFTGLFADRVGRRMSLIASVLLFGAATCSVGLASNIETISMLRFIAGLGIGGALPIGTTMTAEFTPARQRTLSISITCICVPLGGMLAGLFANYVLPVFGWRGLFLIGGVIPMVYGVLLLAILPESPRFLARREHRWAELQKLLSRMSRPSHEATVFTDITEEALERSESVKALFKGGILRDTVAIWCGFFMCLVAVYSAFSWLPTMLSAQGLSLAIARSGLTAWNFGGIIGGIGCGVTIARFGSRGPMVIAAAGGAASAFLLQSIDVSRSAGVFIFGLGVHGMFVNAIQCTLYAVCAHVYTTNIRATGTACALAFGRLGSILSAFLGAAVISAGGSSAYLQLLGVAMTLVTVAMLAIKRHIPTVRSRSGESIEGDGNLAPDSQR